MSTLERINELITLTATMPTLRNSLKELKTEVQILSDNLSVFQSDPEYKQLEAKLEAAEVLLSESHDNNEQLRHEIYLLTKPNACHHQDRPEPEHNILLRLKTGDKLNCSQIACALGINEQNALHHLTQLRKLDRFISEILPPFNSRIPTQWKIWDNGRAYLSERGLL